MQLTAGESVEVRLDYASTLAENVFGSLLDFRLLEPVPEDLLGPAVKAAKKADVAIVVVGMDSIWESEGHDRKDIEPAARPGRADVVPWPKANKRTVVVVNAGAPITMPWRDEVAAIVQLWYLGQEAGNALADVSDRCGRRRRSTAHDVRRIGSKTSRRC